MMTLPVLLVLIPRTRRQDFCSRRRAMLARTLCWTRQDMDRTCSVEEYPTTMCRYGRAQRQLSVCAILQELEQGLLPVSRRGRLLRFAINTPCLCVGRSCCPVVLTRCCWALRARRKLMTQTAKYFVLAVA